MELFQVIFPLPWPRRPLNEAQGKSAEESTTSASGKLSERQPTVKQVVGLPNRSSDWNAWAFVFAEIGADTIYTVMKPTIQ